MSNSSSSSSTEKKEIPIVFEDSSEDDGDDFHFFFDHDKCNNDNFDENDIAEFNKLSKQNRLIEKRIRELNVKFEHHQETFRHYIETLVEYIEKRITEQNITSAYENYKNRKIIYNKHTTRYEQEKEEADWWDNDDQSSE